MGAGKQKGKAAARMALAVVGATLLLAGGALRAETIGTSRQAISVGDPVDLEVQRMLGLVTVDGGCSGTLLRRQWVLTARHCVTMDGELGGPLATPGTIPVTAAWSSIRVSATHIQDLSINAGATPGRDIVLLYLGKGDFGAVDDQELLTTAFDGRASPRLRTSDTVVQYGRGLASFASGTFGTTSQVDSAGGGPYRSARFKPVSITGTDYELLTNQRGQIGHAGDSGGATFVDRYARAGAIAGVQTTCRATGYLMNAPQKWQYATGIADCQYVSVEPFVEEITRLVAGPPPKVLKSSGKPKPSGPAVAHIAAIRGGWNTRTSTDGYFTVVLIPAHDGIGPLAGQAIPVTGQFINQQGAHSYDGTLQGVIPPYSRTLQYSYVQKNGASGTGVFTLSNDGNALTGSGKTSDGTEFTWNGTRAK